MLKRSYIKRGTKQMKRTRIRVAGVSDTAEDKKEIQRLVREIVIVRDKSCVFQKERGHICTGFANDGHLIYQADHLISRSNSATFADTRLIVCVCKGIHGWKSVGANLRKAQYDERLKKILPKERVALWERCEKESWRATKKDWKLEILALQKELKQYER